MANVLSSKEIDALLDGEKDATAAGHDQATSVPSQPVVYDFRHPNRVSKDQLRTLENVHSNFAGQLGSALSTLLRAVIDVDVISVDQHTYLEFVNMLSSPSCTYTFEMKPLDGLCAVDFSPTLSFTFVDRMFGGHGRTMEVERELTGIERSVMDNILSRALKALAQGWLRITEVNMIPSGFESTPQFIQIVPPGESVIVAKLKVGLLSNDGVITLCYPHLTIEPIVERLSGQNWIEASKSGNNERAREVLSENLNMVSSDVTAILATSSITTREFLEVGIGDVIVTDTRINEPARVLVGGLEKFVARPGLKGRHRAVSIEHVTSDDRGLIHEL